MSTCPRTDRLLGLLGDDLPEIEQSELIAHLDTCPDCRGALDRLAARSGLWNDLVLLRDNSPGPPTGDLSKGREPGPPDEEDILVGLLEPTDDPGYLGKLGPYDIIRLIGRGGMGIVFLARDQALDRLVAIKLLTPGMAATGAARRRFSREARAAAAVVHDHVVTIHAVDTLPQGVPYLVMQYVAGKSVQELIDRGKAPELAEILRIGSQAAIALAAAHAQGLIHRDIKPANILLENGVERVKITDFGLARAVDDATMTQSGVVAGTPQYMSPEQARGEPIDHRTDLFSLGSVLYSLCTGQAPFRGTSSVATLKRVCEQTPRPIQTINPEIPSWLVKIIHRLHAKDPANRYGSAAEVADLLGRCLAHVQQPSSVPLPTELCPRRRRAMAIGGTALFCLILAGLLSVSTVREAAAQAASYVATVLRLKTPEGTLVIETEDPDIGVKLDGSELVVSGAGVKELRLSVGEHKLQTIKDGKILRDELVTISRGGRTVLTVRREAENPPPSPASAGLTDAPWPVRRQERDLAQAGRQSRQGPVIPSEKLVLESLGSEVRSVCFSPDGRDFAFGTKEGLIGITGWRFKPGGGLSTTFKAHPGGVESVAFSPDGKTLVSGGWDHHVKLWAMVADRSSPRLLWDFAGFSDGVRSVAFGPGGDQIVAGGFDRVAIVLNAEDGLRVWTSPPLEQPVNGVQFSPDGRWLAMAMGDYSEGTPGNPVGQPGEVQVWSWPGRRRIATLRGWTRECKSVAFSADSRLLAATSGDGTVRLYEKNRNTFDENAVLQGGPWTAGVAFRPDSMQFANSNWSGQVLIWSLNGPKVLTSFQAHDQNISCIAFSTDGRYLATASADGSVKIWDVAERTDAARHELLKVDAAEEVDRLADVLKRNPPRPGVIPGTGMRLYMRDLVQVRTTLIADPSGLGLPFTEIPDWSHDGRRIVFHVQPRKNDWSQAKLVMIESREGRPDFRFLGAGCCPSFSPDDHTIAFLLLPGEVPGEEEGIWLMDAGGTNRRRVCESGTPFWSPDGTELLVNSWFEPTESKLYSLATKRTTRINVPGRSIFSWPRWAGPGLLVACIGGEKEPDSIVLLDLSQPSEARVTSTLWNRSTGPDVYARWPLVSPSTGNSFFIGDEGSKRTLYTLSPGGGPRGRLSALEVGGPKLSGLSLSPDGRYLLFASDRLDREPSGRGERVDQ
jgi:serine/threonine protein kinase/Tol biopolymer transport system component